MKKRTTFLLASLLLFALIGAGAGSVIAQEQETGTVYDVIRTDPRLESFQVLIEAAALSDNLEDDGPFTVFAPTNEALAALQTMELPSGVTPTDLLLYHVVNGEYSSAAVASRSALTTLEGNRLFFDMGAEALMLNEVAAVVEADIQATNGVVHIVDAIVPIPSQHTLFASQAGSPENTIEEVLMIDGRFDTFLSLARQAGLADLLDNPGGNFTVFAPTDEAFANVPEEMMDSWLSDPGGALNTILSYHIVTDRLSINQIATDEFIPTLEGRALAVTTDEDVQVYLNGRPVQSFNILAANGVIHVVDEVVLP